MSRHVCYLHGFASSAQSGKAAYLGERLRDRGVEFHTPDLNEPDFSTLTITRMIGRVTAQIDALEGPVALIGSSLGAFVAVQVAVERPARVSHLILLAPAIDFAGDRMREFGGVTIDEWQRRGRVDVMHYAYGRMMPVNYQLYSDACGYDCVNAKLSMPIQVFQGKRDDVVDPASVENWTLRLAKDRGDVELHMLDDDHQLGSSLPYIWRETARFLNV